MRTNNLFLLTLWLATVCLPLNAQETPPTETSCTLCHGNAEFLGEESLELVTQFKVGTHHSVGLSCHDCHGGNPDPSLSDDPEAAMDERFRPNPYIGSPARSTVPQFCGHCHSDPTFMKRFNPGARVDQETEYWTSQHGQSLKKGDSKVAVCTDCHGVHGILGSDDPGSSVYPTQVAQTCRTCHGDAGYMEGYSGPHGNPLRVDQYARWRQSVHAAALFEKEDLTAPTCNDCHGNHGATPPGLHSVAFVCGQCHGREADLFRSSRKFEALQIHNEFLEDAAGESCGACHESKPRGELPMADSFGECSSCHGNHGIVRPTTTMLAFDLRTPCYTCHEAPQDFMEEFPQLKDGVEEYQTIRDALLAEASDLGLEEGDLYNWLVDQALSLPTHTDPGGEESAALVLKDQFRVLFEKFRIGKTYYTYSDPADGQLTRTEVVRCTHCHEDDGSGSELSRAFVSKMHELTALSAAAERSLLKARRAGIETREAEFEVSQAVDSQIALAALIHTFQGEGAFLDRQEQGLEHVRAALEAGKEAQTELRNRRTGLVVSLVVILFVLVGLSIKIREISRREAESWEK